MRRTTSIITATMLLIVFARITLAEPPKTWLAAGLSGSSEVEVWLGDRLRGVVASYLEPRLSFEEPDYRYPKTVVVSNLKLTAARSAAAPVEILSARRATLELEDIPEPGKPLGILRVRLDQPVVRVLINADGTAVGWPGLRNSDDKRKREPQQSEPVRFEDVFDLREVELVGGRVVCESADGGRPVMELDGIDGKLNVDPREEGWYGLQINMDREPIVAASLEGRINLNDARLELRPFKLNLDMSPKSVGSLPSAVQAFVNERLKVGAMTAVVNGTLPLTNWRSTRLDFDVKLNDADLHTDQYCLQAETIQIRARLDAKQLDFAGVNIKTGDGDLRMQGTLMIDPPHTLELNVQARGLPLTRFLAPKARRGRTAEQLRH